MKKFSNKFLALATAAAIAVPSVVIAATTNIDATANFLAAITLGNEVDMDFDVIEFAAAPAAGDNADLGTDGSIAYAANFSGPGTGTAGSVDVTAGTDGNTVEVFCDTTATMTDGAGASIDVVSIEAAAEGAEAAFGAASACNGIAGAAATTMVLDIGTGTADRFSFGGRIDGATAAAFVAGAYSTANVGGDDIQINVFYQ